MADPMAIQWGSEQGPCRFQQPVACGSAGVENRHHRCIKTHHESAITIARPSQDLTRFRWLFCMHQKRHGKIAGQAGD
ncbi:hypothetical protein LQ953_14885 [Sphingomonas sp. IC-56]|uniref:hypothetical protein n=1 Tax=Sphingomonas sp. IC-56 TaxID=2898529 RepID=UPI001E42AAB0|nr:hypothetical protein [Sphingomonas sp. IC-56]MCD2325306.1 hypothetical protein [Sphingomonas sp. IC-56]